jgi:hypothetical protein
LYEKSFPPCFTSFSNSNFVCPKGAAQCLWQYVFPDGFDSYYSGSSYYDGTINGSFQGGIGLEFMASERNCFEIMWLHQSTHAPTHYLDLGSFGPDEKYTNFDVNIDYLMIGSDGHIQKPGSKVEAMADCFLELPSLVRRTLTTATIIRRQSLPGARDLVATSGRMKNSDKTSGRVFCQ